MMNFDPTGKEKLILKNSKIISRYIRAGKGDVVLRAPSGKAHRYAFLSPKDTHDFPEGTIFVYVFHNDHRYYLGRDTHGTDASDQLSYNHCGQHLGGISGGKTQVISKNKGR